VVATAAVTAAAAAATAAAAAATHRYTAESRAHPLAELIRRRGKALSTDRKWIVVDHRYGQLESIG